MSVLKERNEDDPAWKGLDDGAECLMCERPLSPPVVFWACRTGVDIYLHPECAGYLGCHLIMDARKGDAKPRWAVGGNIYPPFE